VERDVGTKMCGSAIRTIRTCHPIRFIRKSTSSACRWIISDDVNFPTAATGTIEWRAERTGARSTTANLDTTGDPGTNGARQNFERLSFSYLGPARWAATPRFFPPQEAHLHTPNGLLCQGSPGSAPGGVQVTTPADLRLLFPLGGFLNLSGLKANSIAGRTSRSRARVLQADRAGRPGVPGCAHLTGRLVETGNVWEHRGDASFGSLRHVPACFWGWIRFGAGLCGVGVDDRGAACVLLVFRADVLWGARAPWALARRWFAAVALCWPSAPRFPSRAAAPYSLTAASALRAPATPLKLSA